MTRQVWLAARVAILIIATAVSSAYPSLLQLPHLGGRDSGMSGNVVAVPTDGASVLYFNSAGVVGRPTEASFNLMMVNVTGRYTNQATGYDQKSSADVMAPALWFGSDKLAPWYVGAGLYGSVGSAFNFAADPKAGIPSRLLGESGAMHLGLVAGREIVPGLRLGLQVAPTFGQMRIRTPSPLGDVAFDLDGFGIVGAAGLLYDLTERATLGASYRTPGVIFMSGDGRVGGAPDDVDIHFRLPQTVVFGLAYRLTDRLTVTGQGTWVSYGDLEKGRFEFDRNSVLDQKYVSGARGAWNYGGGLEYEVLERAWLRAGLIREEWAIPRSAMRPMLYDLADTMVMVGFGVGLGSWTVDMATGLVEYDSRSVSAQDQPLFPGRYKLSSGVAYTLGVTYRFGGS